VGKFERKLKFGGGRGKRWEALKFLMSGFRDFGISAR